MTAAARIETFPIGPLGCNCSLIVDEASGAALVIDPGGDLAVIQQKLERAEWSVAHILHTHAHVDHLGATRALQAAYEAPAHLHEADLELYDRLSSQASLFGIPVPEECEFETDLTDASCVGLADLQVRVLHTPGHTPGSVSFVLDAADGPVVFTGDSLFRRAIGRTDMWGADQDMLVQSIKNKLLPLDVATRVIPGHGPETTIGEECCANPWFASC